MRGKCEEYGTMHCAKRKKKRATLTTKQNTVCWIVIQYLDKDSSKQNDPFRCSEWGPEAAEALAREIRVFKVPVGKDGKVRTFGEYVDRTPKHFR